MDDASHNTLLELEQSDVYPIKLTTSVVFRYSSQKWMVFGGIFSLFIHFVVLLLLSENVAHTIQLGSGNFKSLAVTIKSRNAKKTETIPSTKSIDQSENSINQNNINVINQENNPIDSPIEIVKQNETELTNAPLQELGLAKKKQRLSVQDLLDNVASYMESESEGSLSSSKEFISMDPRVRKKILNEIKNDKALAYKYTASDISRMNQYFEYKSTGGYSTFRINGKCFIVPEDKAFSNEPKVWLHAGNCEKKETLKF